MAFFYNWTICYHINLDESKTPQTEVNYTSGDKRERDLRSGRLSLKILKITTPANCVPVAEAEDIPYLIKNSDLH